MARKTAIRITNDEIRAAEHAADERLDHFAAAAERAAALPTLATWRAKHGMADATAVLKTARSAARLELRGANYGADDREDVAAEIMRRLLMDTGGAMPAADSPRITLTHFCGIARNLRDSLDRQRKRDAKDAQDERESHALSPLGLGIDPMPAYLLQRLAAETAETAEAAVWRVLTALGLHCGDHPADSPVWLTLYQWVTQSTAAETADARGMGAKLAEKRIAAGAKFLRGFYSAAELADKLTCGARIAADGTVTYAVADLSREAPHKMAEDIAENYRRDTCWREGTDAGTRAERPLTSAAADSACKLGKLTRAERVHWTKQRARRPERDAETASALARLARAHAMAGRRNGGASPAKSTLGEALIEGR